MQYKYFILVIIIIILIITAFLLLRDKDTWIFGLDGVEWLNHGSPAAEKPEYGYRDDFFSCFGQGGVILESYPRQCQINGESFTEDIGNELEKSDLMRIETPRPNQIIQSPLLIKGEARGTWFFEGDFPVRLYDDNDNLIAQGIAKTESDWMTEDFIPFEANLIFERQEDKKGWLLLQKDNPSDLEENDDELLVPVFFNQETMKVKVYFSNNILDPELTYVVFPVEREIPKTLSVARKIIEELLKGPTEKEKAEGFAGVFNQGIEIQSLIIENGVAKIDFNDRLDYHLGGSCTVLPIRNMITETLKQFETVDEVVISINGEIEDVLQP